jgi:hypothetical protein
MPQRFYVPTTFAIIVATLVTACSGSSPTTPTPPPSPAPPQNALPSIDGITAQGRRARQPARFADLRETIDVAATVRDAETPVADLVYQWSATAGSFSGSGRNLAWTAPDNATTPGSVTITLKVVENYGHPGGPKSFSHEVSSTQTIALHDSVKEVGDMSRQFLIDFSTTTLKDWQVVMRNFNRSVCPRPSEYDDERASVIDHYTNFTMHAFDVGPATVNINFGGSCSVPGDQLPGDACVSSRVMWNSTGPGGTSSTRGTDYLSAVYAAADRRWWLCSSRYGADSTLGASYYR